VSILTLLGADGYGGAEALDHPTLGAFLRDSYIHKKDESDRRDRARLLHRYYKATGDTEIEALIGDVFKDKEIIAKRQQWVARAKFNNVIRRVVNEKSTLYAEPARRSISDAAANQRYQDLIKACAFDQVALKINRWLNLHWTLAIGFRVRLLEDGTRQPVVDVVSPDRFWAVCHPEDKSRLVALILELDHCGPKATKGGKYLVWTNKEVFRLDGLGYVMTETWTSNPFQRMPWVLASLDPPGSELIADYVNEDLRAAHESVWFELVCLLKESKSATKIPVTAGDMTNAARGQAADTEGMVNLPEGAVVSVVDMSMDLSMYSATAETIYDMAAANHGLATSIRRHQGVQSADARELARVPLREIRTEQQVPLRRFEREFADVMSMVCAVDLPTFNFTTEGWKVDFGESQTPRGAKEANEIFEHERRLGLTSTAKEKVRRNPDLNVETAMEEIAEDVLLEEERIKLMKVLMQASGEAQGDSRFPGPTDKPNSGPDPQSEREVMQ
jgi:hypothetical protein